MNNLTSPSERSPSPTNPITSWPKYSSAVQADVIELTRKLEDSVVQVQAMSVLFQTAFALLSAPQIAEFNLNKRSAETEKGL